jgi:hypothetical protein
MLDAVDAAAGGEAAMGKIATGGSYTAPTEKTQPLPHQPRLFLRPAGSGPDFGAVVEFWHQDTPAGSYITVAKKDAQGEMREVAAIPASVLRSHASQPCIPELIEELTRDGFFTINATWNSGQKWRTIRRMVRGTIEGQSVLVEKSVSYAERKLHGRFMGLYHPHRKVEDVKWLTSCYVDVDGDRAATPTDVRGTLANVLRAYDVGLIPQPSFFVRSGRGMWAFWRIIDDRNPAASEPAKYLNKAWHYPNTPARAIHYNRELHRRINVALATRLRAIGGDPAAVDAARMVRVPGSINTTAKTRVEIMPFHVQDDAGHYSVARYTLGGLAEAIGLDLSHQRGRPPEDVGREVSESKRARALAGMQARHRKPYNALCRLEELRGGFTKNRHYCLFFLALCGVLSGVPDEELTATVTGIGRRMAGYKADLFDSDIRSQLRSARRKARDTKRGLPYAKLIEEFSISADEQAAIGLTRRYRAPKRARQAQTDAAIIRIITTQRGNVPSFREMSQLLAAGEGITLSHMGVKGSYRRLSLTATQPAGRPKTRRLF